VVVDAQVRAHGEAVAAVATPDRDVVRVDLGMPLRGVAPGQSVVLYDGTRVVGSTTVRETGR
jgi:tRNA-specific 2-thiouridylase